MTKMNIVSRNTAIYGATHRKRGSGSGRSSSSPADGYAMLPEGSSEAVMIAMSLTLCFYTPSSSTLPFSKFQLPALLPSTFESRHCGFPPLPSVSSSSLTVQEQKQSDPVLQDSEQHQSGQAQHNHIVIKVALPRHLLNQSKVLHLTLPSEEPASSLGTAQSEPKASGDIRSRNVAIFP